MTNYFLLPLRSFILPTLFLASSLTCAFAIEEKITLTTYYPSPLGVYREARLVPKDNPTECTEQTEGTMYYDQSKKALRLCARDSNGDYAYNSPCFMKGAVMLWTGGSPLPPGWQLCDGSKGSYDLRNKFIKGASGIGHSYSHGGDNFQKIAFDQMPAHGHGVSWDGVTDVSGNHNHMFTAMDDCDAWFKVPIFPWPGACGDGWLGGACMANCDWAYKWDEPAGQHSHNFSVDVESGWAGGGGSFDNQPEFVTLAYICYVGD